MTCKDCIHDDVCSALEMNGISKISPSQCGCFKQHEDFVEVVRCKDCRYWKQVTEERHACYILGWEMDYDEYCSRGERKEQK